jgi:hypothetical protein
MKGEWEKGIIMTKPIIAGALALGMSALSMALMILLIEKYIEKQVIEARPQPDEIEAARNTKLHVVKAS